MGGTGNKTKEKKRKKAENSPADDSTQRQTKKQVMAATPPPPALMQGYQQASQYPTNITPQQYGYTAQYCLQHTPTPAIPSTPIYQRDAHEESVLNQILARLDNMDKRLSQLDAIQNSVRGIEIHVSKLEEKISSVEGKVTAIELSRDYDSKTIEVLENRHTEIDILLRRMQTVQNEQQERDAQFNSDMTDLKCRSMRDNLVFYNIPEEKDEDCAQTILGFIEEEMKVKDARREIKLHRAHRMGQYSTNKLRPIVAKFTYFPDREKVRKAANVLGGTKFGVSQQFPKEVQEKRRTLVPIMKKAKADGKEAYIVVDKLFINGKLHRCQESRN